MKAPITPFSKCFSSAMSARSAGTVTEFASKVKPTAKMCSFTMSSGRNQAIIFTVASGKSDSHQKAYRCYSRVLVFKWNTPPGFSARYASSKDFLKKEYSSSFGK